MITLLSPGIRVSFIDVSVASGTGVVWLGAGLAILGALLPFFIHGTDTWVKITFCVLAALAIASAGYDQYQIHKR